MTPLLEQSSLVPKACHVYPWLTPFPGVVGHRTEDAFPIEVLVWKAWNVTHVDAAKNQTAATVKCSLCLRGDNRIDLYGDVVSRNDVLGGHIHDDHTQINPRSYSRRILMALNKTANR